MTDALRGNDVRWARFYDCLAPFYARSERVLGRAITGIDILAAREEIAGLIPARRGERILEVSPGPGIYQPALARAVGPEGRIAALDLSRNMLRQCRKATRGQVPPPALVRGNAAWLPFPTACFDGLFHFGGVNLFGEPERALREFSRVVRPGGWVVFGDERFSEGWRARRDWRAALLRRMNPGYGSRPPVTPAALACLSEHEVFGGLGYLRVCRVA